MANEPNIVVMNVIAYSATVEINIVRKKEGKRDEYTNSADYTQDNRFD